MQLDCELVMHWASMALMLSLGLAQSNLISTFSKRRKGQKKMKKERREGREGGTEAAPISVDRLCFVLTSFGRHQGRAT